MKRVLIADDHPIMMRGIEALLRGSGFEVVAKATDGAGVLAALETARPDLLILDVRMPDRTGVDVLRTLRSKGDPRPVVLLTASLSDEALLEAIQLGVNGIVMKDAADQMLVSCLERISGGGRWIDRSVLERALELSTSKGGTSQSPFGSLAKKERTIAHLVARGLRNREIAEELGMTEGTVKVYLHRIFEKLEIKNRTELAIMARDKA